MTSNPVFGAGSNVVKLTGLRCSAQVNYVGGVSQGALDLRVYGVPIDITNRLQVIGGAPVVVAAGNTVLLEAGTSDGPLSTVYYGTISSAWVEYEAMPHTFFHVTALAALQAAVKPAAPTSIKGTADVATIMAGLAKTMGFSFQNNGVNVKLQSPYIWGDAYTQAEELRDMAHIEMAVDNGTLVIWPKGGTRGGPQPTISADTGLVGYPTRTPLGVDLKTLYNPAIRYGATVLVRSDLQTCTGLWTVRSLDHTLESETPNGQWFSHISCVTPGLIA